MVSQCKAVEVPSKSPNFDICVSTIANSYKCECPMVIATGLILNRGTQEIFDKICEILEFK